MKILGCFTRVGSALGVSIIEVLNALLMREVKQKTYTKEK